MVISYYYYYYDYCCSGLSIPRSRKLSMDSEVSGSNPLLGLVLMMPRVSHAMLVVVGISTTDIMYNTTVVMLFRNQCYNT